MQVEDRLLETGYGIISHKIFHGGPKTLLAFHGFGQNAETMAPLAGHLSDSYTTYSFDLFFHGNSIWRHREQTLSKEDWRRIMDEILDTYNIHSFSLAGFSLGGKLVLATLELYPARTEKLFLMAPDGIDTSLWYDLATYPATFRKYFQSMIMKPHRFYNLVNMLKRMKVMDKGLIKFAASQMNSNRKRYRVYYSWIVFKELKFNLNRIAMVLNSHNIPIYIWIGKYDKVIKTKRLKRLTNQLDKCELVFLDCGHNDLIAHVIQQSSKDYNF